jgi:uncharacterized protein YecE (DUF72 family)
LYTRFFSEKLPGALQKDYWIELAKLHSTIFNSQVSIPYLWHTLFSKRENLILIYTGLSGLQLKIRQSDFPEEHKESSRLTYYSTLFNSIEINSCFYKVPKPATVERWASSVHNDFRFTFKLWKEITHRKELYFREEDVRSFMQTISGAGNKKGSLLIQLPPSTDYNWFSQLEKLVSIVYKMNDEYGWKVAVEFRNKSWYKEEVYEMLTMNQCDVVVQDIPRSATPWLEHQLDFVYIRFHGPKGDYRGGYTESFLEEYAGYIKEWSEEGKTVFVYFNNTAGDAYHNLETLNKLF